MVGFNQWLEENNALNWYGQLATYLMKLPMRSARNVTGALYSVISSALYVSVHPIKGINHLTKSMVILMGALTNPAVWPKIGAGTMGLITGQGLILGNPLSLMGLGIGGAFVLAGITVDSFMAAYDAEQGKEWLAVKEKLGCFASKLPEDILTGFFMGMILGGIRRCMKGSEKFSEIENIEQKTAGSPKEHFAKNEYISYKECWKNCWDKVVARENGITLDEAFEIADKNPNITYFFRISNWKEYIGNDPFGQGDTVFFSGKPILSEYPNLGSYIKI